MPSLNLLLLLINGKATQSVCLTIRSLHALKTADIKAQQSIMLASFATITMRLQIQNMYDDVSSLLVYCPSIVTLDQSVLISYCCLIQYSL